MMTLDHLARLYQIPLTDYGPARKGNGLLVAVGSGLMMSVMDVCPELRWCFDTAELRAEKAPRLDDFLIGAQYAAHPVCFAGWFSITDPAKLRAALEALDVAPVVYTGQTPMGIRGEHSNLRELVRAVAEAAAKQPTWEASSEEDFVQE